MNFTEEGMGYAIDHNMQHVTVFPLRGQHTHDNAWFAGRKLQKESGYDALVTRWVKSYFGERFKVYRAAITLLNDYKMHMWQGMKKKERVLFKRLPLWKQRELIKEHYVLGTIPTLQQIVPADRCEHSDNVQDEPVYESPEPIPNVDL